MLQHQKRCADIVRAMMVGFCIHRELTSGATSMFLAHGSGPPYEIKSFKHAVSTIPFSLALQYIVL